MTTRDMGGIFEDLESFRPDGNLFLSFDIKAYLTSEQGKWLAYKTRSL